MNWLDILILLLVVFVAVRGISRGLVKSVMGIVAMVAGFVAGNILYKDVAAFLVRHTGIAGGVREFFNREIFSDLKIPEFESDFSDISREIFREGALWQDYLGNDFGEYMATMILNLLSWLLVFLMVVLVILILGIALDALFKLPLLKTLNALGGFLFGLVKGTLYVFFIVILLEFVGSLSQGDYFRDLVQGSFFAETVLKYNILTWINF